MSKYIDVQRSIDSLRESIRSRAESGDKSPTIERIKPEVRPEPSNDGVLTADYPGSLPLPLGDLTIQCAVLSNELRVISQRGVHVAVGRNRNPSRGQVSTLGEGPAFLSAKNLQPHITDEIRELWKPITYRSRGGYRGNIAFGYRAELLPKVCYVYIDAFEAGDLHKSQLRIYETCRALVRSFATVGIVAMIDECTGYQEIRDRRALEAIFLKEFVSDSWFPWTSQFPLDFYRHVFRLRNWPFDATSTKRPGVLAHITKDIVYARLAPGVLTELQERMPRNASGKPKRKLFQGLTIDCGVPALRDHILSLQALMRASRHWAGFIQLLDRSFPRFDATGQMDFRSELDL